MNDSPPFLSSTLSNYDWRVWSVLMNELCKNIKTISTLEVAEMMSLSHRDVLNKLCGTKDKTGKTKQVGIIPVLTEARFRLSDYFIESTYKDASGRKNKCYEVTKIGCDFLANKLIGKKGIIFTAKYVKRFDGLEKKIASSDSMTANLLLSIYSGGQEGILASRRLSEIEVEKATKPLIETIEKQKPLTNFALHVTESSDTVDVGEFAKIVKNEQIDIGRNRLFRWLRENNYIMNGNIPYQKYLNLGFFEVVETTKKTAYGPKIFLKTLITGKGQVNLVEKLRDEFGIRSVAS